MYWARSLTSVIYRVPFLYEYIHIKKEVSLMHPVQIICGMYLQVVVLMECISYWLCTHTEVLEHSFTRLEISSDDYDRYYLLKCDAV
jgi:hypothetical protein